MTRIALLAAASLTLAACQAPAPAPAPQPGAPSPAEPSPAPTPDAPAPTPPAGANALTDQGFGPVRVGMTMQEVEAVWGPPPGPLDNEMNQCNEFQSRRAPDGVYVMFIDGKVARVTLGQRSQQQTAGGLKVGATPADVRRVHPNAVSEGHKYEERPAEYLFVWSSADHTSPAARGLKFDVGHDGKVQAVSGGNSAIALVEGCS